MANVTFDVQRMEVGEDGVKGFVWPISRQEVLNVRDALLPPLVAVARGSNGAYEQEAELLSIVSGLLVGETMALYQSWALSRRFAEMGRPLRAPKETRLLGPIAAGVTPQMSPMFDTLMAGPGRPRRLGRGTMRRVRSQIQWNGIVSHVFHRQDRERDVVTVQMTDLIDRHARAVPDFVRAMQTRGWFEPLDQQVVREASQEIAGTPVVERAMDAIDIAFSAGNEKIPSFLAVYIRGWLAQAMALSRCHLTDVLERHERLPRRLWTESGGGIWARILRHATRRLGGSVTGHDHGSGQGHLVSAAPTIGEFESCDTFVTFTETRAKALQRGLRADLLIPPKAPEIIAVPSKHRVGKAAQGNSSGEARLKMRRSTEPIRRIMFPSMFYGGELIHFSPLPPDMVQVDWHARLIAHLRGWGYETILKPHPESPSPRPLAFVQELGAKVLTERFEKVLNDADAFLFDYPRTTTFRVALNTDKPVIFIDWGQDPLTEEARGLLEQRCAIVGARLDEANRIQIDWDELRAAIAAAPGLNSTEFVVKYWGDGI